MPYSGVTTLAHATTFSDNAVYAQVGIKTGTKKIARTAERMGIRTPVSSNYAITLGGLKHGVTPLDMAHAYQTLATGGVLVTGTLGTGPRGPVGMRKVTLRNHRDRVLRRNHKRSERIMPQNVAQTTTKILESVVKVGTARVASLGKVRAWGKTGTTENYGDAWFVGATDKYTVAVWVGYPNGLKSMRTEYRGQPVAGGTYPAQIWHDFMLAVLEADQLRAEKRCARQEAKLKPGDPPPKVCVDAGIAVDPSKETPDATTTVPSTTTPTTTTPAEDQGDGGTPADQGNPADPGAGTEAAPLDPTAPQDPTAPAPAVPAPGTAPERTVVPSAPSGGATPQP